MTTSIRKTRVLIVDDEERFAEMVKMNLEDLGNYHVQVERLGSHGLKAVEEFHPDIVLMDIMMRDLGGPVSAKRIKADARFKHLPIIFFSAAVPKSHSDCATDTFAGFPYLAKPARTDVLVKTIESYVDRHRLFFGTTTE